MYATEQFSETDKVVLLKTISDHPFSTLIINGDEGPITAYIPMIMEEKSITDDLVFIGHVARKNPFWQTAENSFALAVFSGPDGYVSPSYYPSKQEHGRVVPTWNYQKVEVRGVLKVESNPDCLRPYIETLTRFKETGRANPWAVSDAPDEYISALLRGIIGLRLEVKSIFGKNKLSQNKNENDRAGVIDGFRAEKENDIRRLMEKYTRG